MGSLHLIPELLTAGVGGSNIASWKQCGLCGLPCPGVNLPGHSDIIDVLGCRGSFYEYIKLHYGVRYVNIICDKCLSQVLTPLVYKGNVCEGYW